MWAETLSGEERQLQRTAEQRPSGLDETGLEEVEQFGVAVFLGEQGTEDSRAVEDITAGT
jgi:hypothetical protein